MRQMFNQDCCFGTFFLLYTRGQQLFENMYVGCKL